MPGGKGFFIIIGVLFAIGVIIVGWWLLSPLFITKTVDEEFPLTANAVIPEGMERVEAEMVMATMAGMGEKVDEAMPDVPAAQGVGRAGSDGVPTLLKGGAFRDGDRFHKGSGQALIYDLPDGSQVLRFEDLEVTNGPDLRVILTTVPDPDSSEDVHATGYIELDKLKGNVGNQNYPIPTGADVDSFKSVVIYCKPFRVVFAVANLS